MWFWRRFFISFSVLTVSFGLGLDLDSNLFGLGLDLDSNLFGLGLDSDSIVLVLDLSWTRQRWTWLQPYCRVLWHIDTNFKWFSTVACRVLSVVTRLGRHVHWALSPGIMSRHAPYCWLATSLFWYWARLSFLKRFWKNTFPTFKIIIALQAGKNK